MMIPIVLFDRTTIIILYCTYYYLLDFVVDGMTVVSDVACQKENQRPRNSFDAPYLGSHTTFVFIIALSQNSGALNSKLPSMKEV